MTGKAHIFQIYQGKIILSLEKGDYPINVELTHAQFINMLPLFTDEDASNSPYGLNVRKKHLFDLKGYEIAYGRENAEALDRILWDDYGIILNEGE